MLLLTALFMLDQCDDPKTYHLDPEVVCIRKMLSPDDNAYLQAVLDIIDYCQNQGA